MRRLKIALAAIIAVVVIILVFQNTEEVNTRLLVATVTMPRAMLLFVTFLLGFAAGAIVCTSISRKKRPK